MKYALTNLRCEYLVSPNAIDAKKPRLSWEGLCQRQGAAQSAYRILGSSSLENLKMNKGDLWDSGQVESNQSLHIHWGGRGLKSSQQVHWKVMAWDEKGTAGSWSKPTQFTMGLLESKEWKGVYIGNYLGNTNSAPLLRKEFKVKKKVKRALFYATACGLYHLTLDGKEVHDDLFAPGWTDYDKRLYYRAHDVTKHLKKVGAHCIGAELGDGWYRERYGCWTDRSKRYGTRVQLKAQLRLEYEDGKVEVIPTDESWSSVLGHTLQNSFYNGETVDSQLEPKNWNKPGFNDKGWSSAVSRPKMRSTVPLEAYPAEPVRITEELKPIKCWSVAQGKVIYDFGQNFAGRVRIHVPGKAGAVIRMRFGEMVNLDNTLYADNMRSALCTDTYIMKGLKHEVWEPKFTFHGFRYVEISGCPVAPRLSNVTGVVIGSDTTRTGHFECSSSMVNQIYSNAVWTQRANFLEVPTDCPQRDERLGWTGDAQVFIRTAIANMDVAAFFTKWMNDLLDSQYPDGAFPNVAPDVLDSRGGAAWGDAGVVCPWTLYQCYEDKDLLEKMYPAMKRWVEYLKKTSDNLLCKTTQCFGDWLAINADTPRDVIRTAHFAYATDLTRKAAEALGKKADSKRYGALFSDIKRVFNKHFVKKNGKIEGDTQTAYLMALKFDLLDEKEKSLASKHLIADIRKKKYHSSTGFVGTALIMSVLRDAGQLDVAYRLLENTTFPSWGYSVVNGATSIWERWNGWTKENGPGDVNMNSYSHYAYGAVVEWMFDTIAGIDHSGVGFQELTLKPQPGGSLKYASASYDSPYGSIKSAWQKRGKGLFWEVVVPPNTKARVIPPTAQIDKIKLNGLKLSMCEGLDMIEGGFFLPAGRYEIQV